MSQKAEIPNTDALKHSSSICEHHQWSYMLFANQKKAGWNKGGDNMAVSEKVRPKTQDKISKDN